MPPRTYERTPGRLSVEPAQGEPAPEYRGRRRRQPDVELPPAEPFPTEPFPTEPERPESQRPADVTIELPAVTAHGYPRPAAHHEDHLGSQSAEPSSTWPVEPLGFEQWAQALLGEQWQTSEQVQQVVDSGDDVLESFLPEPEPPCLVVPPPQFLTRAEAKAAAARHASGTNLRRAPQRRLVDPTPQPVGVRRYRGLTAAAALATVGAIGGASLLVDNVLSNDSSGQAAGSLSDSLVTEAAAVRGTEQALGAARGGTVAAQTSTLRASTQQTPRFTATERAFRMVAVSRAQERGPINGCSGRAPARQFSNGQIPSSELCALPFAPGHKLRADAAVRLIRLNEVYRGEFGENLCLTDSYRSLSSQYSLRARKPGLAARPGTSEHGWGLAIDMCDGPDVPGSARRAWMLEHAPEFGWDNPDWALPETGSKPEPWHWEFLEGEK